MELECLCLVREHAVAQLVEARLREVTGSIPDGIIAIFH